MGTFVHHTSWAYSAPAMTYPYSTTLGTTLLEDAGWTLPTGGIIRMKGGQELALTLSTTTSTLRMTIMAVFENQMRDCGIRLIRNHQPSSWFFGGSTSLFVRDFEVAEFAWITDQNDPGGDELYACDQIPTPANGWSGQNVMGWCNPTASDAIIQASDTSLPQPTRQAHYATFIDLFAEDMTSLPLFAREDNYGVWEHVDFNLETYSQGVNVTYNDGGTLNFTSFHGYDGSLFVPARVVTPTTGMMYSPLEGALGETPDGMEHLINFRLTALENGVPLTAFTFSEPVTLTHSYGFFADPLNIYEDTLGFYYWDGSDWMPAAETCPEGQRRVDLDTENNTLLTRICHFSEFSMMGEEKYNIYHPLIVRGE